MEADEEEDAKEIFAESHCSRWHDSYVNTRGMGTLASFAWLIAGSGPVPIKSSLLWRELRFHHGT